MALVWQILSLAALAAGSYIGLRIPDIDQSTWFLLHRSAITHGPLLPLAAFALALGSGAPVRRRLGMGVCIGFAIHTAFDLFPRAWQGYALISVPVYGWTPPVVSWLWLAGTTVICTGLAVRLIRDMGDGVVLLIALAASFAMAAGGENAMWRPLSAITVSLVIAVLAVRKLQRPERKQWKQLMNTRP